MCWCIQTTRACYELEIRGWEFTIVTNIVTRGVVFKKTTSVVAIVWNDDKKPTEFYKFWGRPEFYYNTPANVILSMCKERGVAVSYDQAVEALRVNELYCVDP